MGRRPRTGTHGGASWFATTTKKSVDVNCLLTYLFTGRAKAEETRFAT